MPGCRPRVVVPLAAVLLLPGARALAQRADSDTAAVPTVASSPQALTLARLVHRTRLGNGLDVIAVENPVVPLATVLVAVRNGAFTQDSAEEGLAHLYEHMLFRSYPGGPLSFWGDVAALTGRANGATSQEVVYYFVSVPSQHVDGAIAIVARLLENGRFSNRDLSEERRVVLDELQRDQSDPEGRLAREVERALWGRSWSRKDISGDSSSLAGMTLDHLRRVYARYYVPNNAALIVTGDVSSEHVFEEVRRRFDTWKAGPDPFAGLKPLGVAPLRGATAVMLPGHVLDVTIRIAFQGPGVATDTAATYAADAVLDVLNDPASSFQQRLVESGLFQSVSGGYNTLNHTGPIYVLGKTTTEHARQALVALVSELDNLDVLEGVTDEDLEITKKQREVGFALTLEHTATLAPQLAQWWAIGGLEYYLGYGARMAAQTLDDLRHFADAYIASKPRVIGILAPLATIAELAAWLRPKAGPVSP